MIRTDVQQLKARLLNFGGKAFQYDWVLESELSETEVEQLLKTGRLWDGSAATLRRMERNMCHENVEDLVAENPKLVRYLGLALGDHGTRDQIWRVHSWALTPNGEIIETTTLRKLYFGMPVKDTDQETLLEDAC